MACKERINTVLLDTTHGLQREKKYSITRHNPWPAKREKNTVLLNTTHGLQREKKYSITKHNPWPAKREEIQYY